MQGHAGYATDCGDGPYTLIAGSGVTPHLSCSAEVHCNSSSTCGVWASWWIGSAGYSGNFLSAGYGGQGAAGARSTIGGGEFCEGINGCSDYYVFDMNDGDTTTMTCESTDGTVGVNLVLGCAFSFI